MTTRDLTKMSTKDYLKDLAARLRHVPATYGTDQYDCERLKEIAENGDFDDVEECMCHYEDDYKYPCPIHNGSEDEDEDEA